jgi:integrase
MILLGINCGFGNADVASLPKKAMDLKSGWVEFPRSKTGIARRCPLWPETVAAVKDALNARQKPRNDSDPNLVFVTKFGRPWIICVVIEKKSVDNSEPDKPTIKQQDSVAKEFCKLLVKLRLHRPGLGFYALRHTFETIGGDCRDQVAVDAIMGHARDDMASVYRERIDDARLVAVTEHVRQWLFGDTKQE